MDVVHHNLRKILIREVGTRTATREQAVRVAELNKEQQDGERRAALEAPAKAEKAKIIVDARAEARGQYEILAKKGEGFRAIIEACGGANPAFQMMMIEHLDKLAETSARAISNIKFDKVVVWENGKENGQTSTANFLQGMSRTMPPMLQVLRDIAGIELPETLVKVTPESNGHEAVKTVSAPDR